MIAFGSGRLKLSSYVATDGVIFFKVFSPSLRRIMKHRKRDLLVVGNFICVGDRIVLFRKVKQK
jgi:hypothetical protein